MTRPGRSLASPPSRSRHTCSLGLVLLALAGCRSVQLGGSLGPTISVGGTGAAADGDAHLNIEAGADVGYDLHVWRNKSAPNVRSQTTDTTIRQENP